MNQSFLEYVLYRFAMLCISKRQKAANKHWVLAWPEGVVLEPKELKQQLIEVGRELLEKYK